MHVSGLGSSYLAGEASELVGQQEGRLLASFGEPCIVRLEERHIRTGLRSLESAPVCEALIPAGAREVVRNGELLQLAGSDTLLLSICVNESVLGGLQAATRYAYRQLLGALECSGYPHVVRVWNYFADINHVDQGLERYRQFCIGRFEAFDEQGISDDRFPSACALGHAGGDLVVYLLASRQAPEHFENPFQVSAYRYPEEYGPRSPSFARGSLLRLPGAVPQLFVSGTASVVGHRTLSVGDLVGQLRVTFDNLEQLMAHISKSVDLPRPLVPELLKVYLRYAKDLSQVRAAVTARFGDVPVLYVQADICRSDLLLEIDGVWREAAP